MGAQECMTSSERTENTKTEISYEATKAVLTWAENVSVMSYKTADERIGLRGLEGH